jgi:hypothetical protein
MNGYMLYRKEGHTALVLIAENDDELHYVLSKLHRSRVKWLKEFTRNLLKEFFEETNTNEKD